MSQTIDSLLRAVQSGELSIEEAKIQLTKASYDEMGFAKLDTARASRTGFAEVVFCPNKADDHLQAIFQRLIKANGEVLGTRCSPAQFEMLQKALPQLSYDGQSRIVKVAKDKPLVGQIAVCTAGTADIAIAEECAQTAEFFGHHVDRIYDVGVSGIHRLLSQLDRIQKANCVVAIAGMEGALASVVAGLVSCPVIAVPTSVGYGANFHGLSALLTMINSCANGVATVNIDNGFGAAFLACQINRLASRQAQ